MLHALLLWRGLGEAHILEYAADADNDKPQKSRACRTTNDRDEGDWPIIYATLWNMLALSERLRVDLSNAGKNGIVRGRMNQ